MNSSFANDFIAALNDFYHGFMQFMPRLLAAFVILIIGWMLSLLLRSIVRKGLVTARFDRFSDNLGITQIFGKAGITGKPSDLFGSFIFWLVLTMVMMASVGALEISALSAIVASFFTYLPRVFSALLILIVGFLIGSFLSRAAVLAVVNAGLNSATLVGEGVRLLITIIAFAMALEQLQIAAGIVRSAFTITFGALMLSAALALGLGGRDVARQLLEERFLKKDKKTDDELMHI